MIDVILATAPETPAMRRNLSLIFSALQGPYGRIPSADLAR
jgi:hypothetical protein